MAEIRPAGSDKPNALEGTEKDCLLAPVLAQQSSPEAER